MSIRTRLALWYAGIMFVSLLAMGALSYHAFAPEPRAPRQSVGDASNPDDTDESDLGEIFPIIFWCGMPACLLALGGGRTLASGTLTDVLGSFGGAIARTASPRRRAWAWRRGREYHEYWPTALDVPFDAVAVTPDLEDVVVTLSMLKQHESELAS